MKSKRELRIVFMGTPDFAVTALRYLLAADYNVVAVVTNDDKKSGRGMQEQASAVKIFAQQHNLPVLQPKNLKSPDFQEELASYHADVQVVVAFRMLPVSVWDMPPYGTINIHASLLPDYRGAAPINWAIINGETQTGVTTFQLKHEIDAGDILLQQPVAISKTETAGSLHDKLAETGGQLIVQTLDELCSGKLISKPQPFNNADKKAPKIFKDDCIITWSKKGDDIINFVRGLNPYPAAHMYLQEKIVKVFQCNYTADSNSPAPGFVDTDDKEYIRIACQDGWIYLNEIQMQGKKRMKVTDFLRGNRIIKGNLA